MLTTHAGWQWGGRHERNHITMLQHNFDYFFLPCPLENAGGIRRGSLRGFCSFVFVSGARLQLSTVERTLDLNHVHGESERAMVNIHVYIIS